MYKNFPAILIKSNFKFLVLNYNFIENTTFANSGINSAKALTRHFLEL